MPRGRRHARWRGALLAFALPCLLANTGLELDRLLRDFEIVAFGAEYQETDRRLYKWTGPLRVHLEIHAGDPALYRSLTTNHLELLAELTGLQISLTDDPSDANFVMVFDRGAQLFDSTGRHAPSLAQHRVLMRDALCFGQYSRDRQGRITRAVIGIPTDRAASAGKLPACIVEETTQALGLPNDSDEVNPSIFNDRSVLDQLTEHDRILVRLLYDPRLAPGAGRDEALPVARQILREWGH